MADEERRRHQPWPCALRSQGAGGWRGRRAVAPRRRVDGRRSGADRKRARRSGKLSARQPLPLLARPEQQQFRRLGAAPRRHPVRFALEGHREEMADVMVREAQLADVRTIADIHVSAWRAAYRGMIPDEYLAALSVEQRMGRWSTAISAPGPARVAVAHVKAEILGFCSFGPTRDAAPSDIAEIYSLNVRPDCWRRGAGRM